MEAVLYIHGMSGSARESEHYKKFFPGRAVTGLDYRTFTPWETGAEILEAVSELKKCYDGVTLIANSIGAFFSMYSGAGALIDRAFFISPVVDMERMILGMIERAGVTEEELRRQGGIRTASGEDLSREYLCRVRERPVSWGVPTHIIYGGRDTLVPYDSVSGFAEKHGASLTVMENGEHWFHTAEQMRFLDNWLRDSLFEIRPLCESETGTALDLAWRVFSEYESPVYPPEGTEEFRKSIHDENYLSGIRYYGAFDGTELIGEIGVRPDRRHICFFFVDGRYHRLGIGTALFYRMLADLPDRRVTLNSSPCGLPFYKTLGFTPTDGETTVNGIRFTPMEYGR